MFSASQTPEHISRALDSGAKGFIAKPFRKKSLWHYIHLSMEHYDKLLSELYG
jgi:AmiR/NasT family two-component response regulator